MYLRSVELINWRSYRWARFEFPRPNGEKNVILVMAPNEYGKTSLFEAITLGLFGRSGLILVPRARAAAGNNTEDYLTTSFSRFLEGALHRQATEDGPPECVVKLEWEDDGGNPIEIKRTWYFHPRGDHKAADDQLQIYEGRERAPVAPPPMTVSDQDSWYLDWIAQRFLQPSLAEFFLFDGEQVQRYANRDMSDQVRKGIEGLLGLPVLHNLKDSLVRYAQNRRRSNTAAPSDKTMKAVEADIEKLENLIDKGNKELAEANDRLPALDTEIETLTQRLGGRREGTTALIKSLLEDESRYDAEARRAIEDLMELIAGDMAFAISGTALRNETIACLKAEEQREAWEAGRNEGDRNLDRFTTDLSRRVGLFEPPLGAERCEAVIKAARAAWQALWHPAPDGCADSYLHPGLTGTARTSTIEHLEKVGRHSSAEASNHVQRLSDSRTTAERKRREYLELERNAPEDAKLTERLKELSEQRGGEIKRRDMAKMDVEAAAADLGKKRAELGRYISRTGKRTPALVYAEQADAYARLIEDLVNDAMPFEVDEVAREMTKVWKAMAHMSDRIDRIEISSDCEVKMLTADGSDLHQLDKSAGASQVFTQALIAAITRVSGRTFPFIVDTPLARLSREQRLGVLRTFTDRTGQVILLSTDEEVVDDKLEAIRNKIAASYELKIAYEGGSAVTTVHDLDLGNIQT